MRSVVREPTMVAGLKTRLRGVVVIAGVGNAFRGDDGLGPGLVALLKERLEKLRTFPPGVHLIDCCRSPENYIGSIARLRPDTVVVVDVADLGLAAGEARIVEADDLLEHHPSTHRMSPALFMHRLKGETAADVFMIAVQPAAIGFGEGPSLPVHRALVKLADLIESAIGQQYVR